jgi:hypothetical protein
MNTFIENRMPTRGEVARMVVLVLCACALETMTITYAFQQETRRVSGQPLGVADVAVADDFRPEKAAARYQPITEFDVVTARDVGDKINPSELVVATTLNGKSRAYPINMLAGPSREILNDELGGTAIAATW